MGGLNVQLQVTEIEFDFDDEDPVTTEYAQFMHTETIGQIWEVDNEDDLVEEITCATGWCIKSINYRHILTWSWHKHSSTNFIQLSTKLMN